MIPQHDSRLRMELGAGRCGPAERGDVVIKGGGGAALLQRERAQLIIQLSSSLTSTSSPVVYINSLMKSTAAGSPHTWISSAHRPTQTHKEKVKRFMKQKVEFMNQM